MRIRSMPLRRMNATTALESSPPERNTPTGTSLTRWLRTASCIAVPQHRLVLGARPLDRFDVQIPVGACLDATVTEAEPGARLQLHHSLEHRVRLGHEFVPDEVIQRLQIRAPRKLLGTEDRFDLRREDQALATRRVVQRLDAHSIPSEEQRLRSSRPRSRMQTSRAVDRDTRGRTPRTRGRSLRSRCGCGTRALPPRACAVTRRSCRFRR